MTTTFVSYISLTPTLTILKCRKYLIVSFALCEDCWSMVCLDLAGWQMQYYAFLFALLTVSIISGHLIFAQGSDWSISLKGPMNSWQGQAQIGVSDWNNFFIGRIKGPPHGRTKSCHWVSGVTKCSLGLWSQKRRSRECSSSFGRTATLWRC